MQTHFEQGNCLWPSVARQHSPTNGETGRQPIKLSHPEAIAAALHRSLAAFLVDSDEAAIVEQIAGNQERSLQVLFFLETLIEQPDAADPAAEEPAS